MFRKSHKLVRKVVCLVAVLSGSVLAVQSQVNAETFQIGGFGLNTNNNFGRIDGQPKMSSWQHNPNDNDQQFDRLSGKNGASLLKHRSTGKCVNAYRGNGSEFNVWGCNANDGDQNWNIINLGGGKVQLQKVGTNLCIYMSDRRNYGIVKMQTCDRNNGNQQWVSSNGGGQPQLPQPSPTSFKMPWSSSTTAGINGGWHPDGYGLFSVDFLLGKGQNVLAPFDSTVLSHCNAGNNHRAIKLKASNGRIYSIIHVNTSSVKTSYRQGEKIGVVASDTPNNACARSTGPHLHMGFDTQDFVIDGYIFKPNSLPSGNLRSTQP